MKITISREGSSPISIDVPEKSVESRTELIDTPELNPEVAREAALADLSVVDRLFAECARESADPARSEEGFPRYNSILSLTGTKMVSGVNHFKTDEKFKDVCKRIKEYCAAKNWEIVKEADSTQLKTLWTTIIGKDTSDYRRPSAKSETWITVEGVPVCFLEFDEYRNQYDANGNYMGQYHVHYISAHVFLKKPGANRIFSKCVITKAKMGTDKGRSK